MDDRDTIERAKKILRPFRINMGHNDCTSMLRALWELLYRQESKHIGYIDSDDLPPTGTVFEFKEDNATLTWCCNKQLWFAITESDPPRASTMAISDWNLNWAHKVKDVHLPKEPARPKLRIYQQDHRVYIEDYLCSAYHTKSAAREEVRQLRRAVESAGIKVVTETMKGAGADAKR